MQTRALQSAQDGYLPLNVVQVGRLFLAGQVGHAQELADALARVQPLIGATLHKPHSPKAALTQLPVPLIPVEGTSPYTIGSMWQGSAAHTNTLQNFITWPATTETQVWPTVVQTVLYRVSVEDILDLQVPWKAAVDRLAVVHALDVPNIDAGHGR